jgi:hypothetical protein
MAAGAAGGVVENHGTESNPGEDRSAAARPAHRRISHPCSGRFGDAIRRDEAFACTVFGAAKHRNTAPAEHRCRINAFGNGPVETGGDFVGALSDRFLAIRPVCDD